MQLGISGRLAAAFKQNQITPLLALVSLLLGLFAVLVTPREEEPQIEVTFANVFIAYPGASAAMVVKAAQDAAKAAVLSGKQLVTQADLLQAITEQRRGDGPAPEA